MDFRTYLAQNAPQYLAFTGNDARIDPTKKGYDTGVASYANTAGNRNTVQNEVNSLFSQYSNQAFNRNIGGQSFGGGYTPQVYAPKLDLSSIYSQASSKAQANVNPFYTKQLNDFVAQQGQEKALQQQQTQMNIKNLQDQLANTLQGNEISGQRTSQDVLQNEQQLGIKADQQQQDQGTQFEDARLAQAKQLAGQGLTTSGVGQQQAEKSLTDFNTQESRQAADTAQQNQAQELFKSRTFEDLARSGKLATQAEGKGEEQANFDFNKFVQQQGFDLSSKTSSLESERLARVAQETQAQGKLLVNNWIGSLSNPAQRLAAAQQYGGAF